MELGKTYQDIHITNGKDNGKDNDVIRNVKIYGIFIKKNFIDILALDDINGKELSIAVPKLPGYKVTIELGKEVRKNDKK